MNKDKIQEFINKGEEGEFLDKLLTYKYISYVGIAKNFFTILLYLMEHGNDKWSAIQNFKKTFLDLLSNLSNEDIDDFINLVEKEAEEPYTSISLIVRELIISVEDKDPHFEGLSVDVVLFLKRKLQNLNVYLLKKSIENEKTPFTHISNNFNNCVDHLEEERKVILLPEAILEYRNYLLKDSKDYLENFLRPYYSGTNKTNIEHYLHVIEPFSWQIFNEDFTFYDFLENAKEHDIDLSLLKDIIEFYNQILDLPKENVDKYKVLYSEEMKSKEFIHFNPYAIPENYLKILSDKHENVRKECLPPNYKLK